MAVRDIFQAVMDYEEGRTADLVRQEIAAGTDIKVILDEGIVSALDAVGIRFSEGVLFVPEMLMAAEAAEAGLNVLRPLLADAGAKPVGTVVIGTVKGDLHDIGKGLVATMLEGAGFRIVDLGTDVDAESFISAAQENEAEIIALSALLTTSMPEMEKALTAIREANGNRNLNVKVMVGGPPVNREFAERIGAEGYGVDATAAVREARGLVH